MMTWVWSLGPTEWMEKVESWPLYRCHGMSSTVLSGLLFPAVSYLAFLMSPNHPFDPWPTQGILPICLQPEVDIVGFGWLISSKGSQIALLYIQELIFFLFYQKAHLSLYGKLFNNHLKINEKAKCIIFYSSWYTISFLSLDNIFNHTRSHKQCFTLRFENGRIAEFLKITAASPKEHIRHSLSWGGTAGMLGVQPG